MIDFSSKPFFNEKRYEIEKHPKKSFLGELQNDYQTAGGGSNVSFKKTSWPPAIGEDRVKKKRFLKLKKCTTFPRFEP